MSTTASGIPRVKAVRPIKVRPLEPTAKLEVRKKAKKSDPDDPDDPLNAWRKK